MANSNFVQSSHTNNSIIVAAMFGRRILPQIFLRVMRIHCKVGRGMASKISSQLIRVFGRCNRCEVHSWSGTCLAKLASDEELVVHFVMRSAVDSRKLRPLGDFGVAMPAPLARLS